MKTMLLQRFPKLDIMIPKNHKNKNNNSFEPQSHMGKILKHLERINIELYNHGRSSLQDLHHHGFNSRPRSYLIPKIDMRKFDGKNTIIWIFHIEQFFDLHQVPRLEKVTIASSYLENDQFVRYQWICERKKDSIISWSIFTNELIEHYGHIKINAFFIQLINLQQRGPITEHIQQFQKIILRVNNIP
jgi:hypothetical protein